MVFNVVMNIVQKILGYSSNYLRRFDTGAQLTPRRRIKRRETDVVGIPAQHQLAEDAAPQSLLAHLDDGAVLRRDGGDVRAHAGIFPAEAADDLRQPVLGNAGIRPDAQLILLRGAQGAHRVLEGVALAQDPLDIRHDGLTRLCQTHAFRPAAQERIADLLLEPLEHPRQARLRIAHVLRRLRDAADLDGGLERLQLFDIHRTHLLGSCYHKEKSLTRTNSRKKGASGRPPSGNNRHELPRTGHQPRLHLHENRRL